MLADTIVSISLPSAIIYDHTFLLLSKAPASKSLMKITALEFVLTAESAKLFVDFPNLARMSALMSSPCDSMREEYQKGEESDSEEQLLHMDFDPDLPLEIPDVPTVSINYNGNFKIIEKLSNYVNLTSLMLRSVGAFTAQTEWPPMLKALRISQFHRGIVAEDANLRCTIFCENLIASSPLLEEILIICHSTRFRRAHTQQLLEGLKHLKSLHIKNYMPSSGSDSDDSDEDDNFRDIPVPISEEPLEICHNSLEVIPTVLGVQLVPRCLPAVRRIELQTLLEVSGDAFPNLASINGYFNRYNANQLKRIQSELPKQRFLRRFAFDVVDNQLPPILNLKSLHAIDLTRISLLGSAIETLFTALPLLLDASLHWGEPIGSKPADCSWMKHKSLIRLHLITRCDSPSELIMSPSLPSLESLICDSVLRLDSKLSFHGLLALRSLHIHAPVGGSAHVSITECPLLFRVQISTLSVLSWSSIGSDSIQLLQLDSDTSIQSSAQLPESITVMKPAKRGNTI
jgi:hypothetical protein